MQTRDIIVLGGSAGGVEAMSRIVAAFPADLNAAVFIVVHVAAGFESTLPAILSKRGRLRATAAIHGEPIEAGRIYVAPPDNHLLVRPGFVAVQRGPKENGHRPAVDPLFRSASIAYGSRVIAVIVSGYLDCGTAGLLSVKARGGVAIVQRPDEAAVPQMPRSAIEHASVDHVLSLDEIGPLIVRLTGEAAPPADRRAPTSSLLEVEGDELGVGSFVVCPICQGVMTEGQIGSAMTFRCHVGHAFSPAALLAEQAESLERALWSAVRALDESAAMAERMVSIGGDVAKRLDEKARTQRSQADLVRRMLLGHGTLSSKDSEESAPRKSTARSKTAAPSERSASSKKTSTRGVSAPSKKTALNRAAASTNAARRRDAVPSKRKIPSEAIAPSKKVASAGHRRS